MFRHRSLRLALGASVLAVVAACSGSAPAAPALTDPVDILVQSVQTLDDVKSFRADVAACWPDIHDGWVLTAKSSFAWPVSSPALDFQSPRQGVGHHLVPAGIAGGLVRPR